MLVPKVRIKKVELIAEDKLALVTLEALDREFQFAVDLWEIYDLKNNDLDMSRINEILLHWKNNVIPRRLAVEVKSREQKLNLIKRMEGIEV